MPSGERQSSNPSAELQLDNLTCRRGRRTLFSELSLTLQAGEAVALSGANGRGKTTLLRTICGLQRPEAGQVLRRGVDVHEAMEADRDLLYLAHENALNPDLTPTENLASLARLHGGRSNIGEALDRLGMTPHAQRRCRHLSAGQRRRTALARLPLSRAGLWLLDEPASALDAAGRVLLCELLAAHVVAGGAALFTTHEPLALPDVSVRTLQL